MWTIVILAVAPVATAGIVSYGGEIALRILLFSLAPAAILMASLIDFRPIGRSALVAFLVLSAGFLALFPLARYGNETFEAITPGDLAASEWIHDHVPKGTFVFIDDSNVPFNYGAVGDYSLETLSDQGGDVNLLAREIRNLAPSSGGRPSYLYFSQSQQNVGTDLIGYPPDWLNALSQQIVQSGLGTVVYKDSTAIVMRINPSTRQTADVNKSSTGRGAIRQYLEREFALHQYLESEASVRRYLESEFAFKHFLEAQARHPTLQPSAELGTGSAASSAGSSESAP